MINLLINQKSDTSLTSETSFGGIPIKNLNKSEDWPKCKSCKSEMQFLGQVRTDIGTELIFMCQNEPGMCDDWDADGGGNCVRIIDSGKFEEFIPEDIDGHVRNAKYGTKVIKFDATNYDEARVNWAKQNGVGAREVLGQLYGSPSWLQNDETPSCDCCKKSMRFVAQLEQGPDWKTEMNFGGGGCAYLFDCIEFKTAKFLWQC